MMPTAVHPIVRLSTRRAYDEGESGERWCRFGGSLLYRRQSAGSEEGLSTDDATSVTATGHVQKQIVVRADPAESHVPRRLPPAGQTRADDTPFSPTYFFGLGGATRRSDLRGPRLGHVCDGSGANAPRHIDRVRFSSAAAASSLIAAEQPGTCPGSTRRTCQAP